jgi:hypothetical protein
MQQRHLFLIERTAHANLNLLWSNILVWFVEIFNSIVIEVGQCLELSGLVITTNNTNVFWLKFKLSESFFFRVVSENRYRLHFFRKIGIKWWVYQKKWKLGGAAAAFAPFQFKAASDGQRFVRTTDFLPYQFLKLAYRFKVCDYKFYRLSSISTIFWLNKLPRNLSDKIFKIRFCGQ